MKISPGIAVLGLFKTSKVSTETQGAQLLAFSLYSLVIRSPLPLNKNFLHGGLTRLSYFGKYKYKKDYTKENHFSLIGNLHIHSMIFLRVSVLIKT